MSEDLLPGKPHFIFNACCFFRLVVGGGKKTEAVIVVPLVKRGDIGFRKFDVGIACRRAVMTDSP